MCGNGRIHTRHMRTHLLHVKRLRVQPDAAVHTQMRLLRTHCAEISPLFLSLSFSLSFPSSLLTLLLVLSSVHVTKLPFDVKRPSRLSLRPLSISTSLPPAPPVTAHDYCI